MSSRYLPTSLFSFTHTPEKENRGYVRVRSFFSSSDPREVENNFLYSLYCRPRQLGKWASTCSRVVTIGLVAVRSAADERKETR